MSHFKYRKYLNSSHPICFISYNVVQLHFKYWRSRTSQNVNSSVCTPLYISFYPFAINPYSQKRHSLIPIHQHNNNGCHNRPFNRRRPINRRRPQQAPLIFHHLQAFASPWFLSNRNFHRPVRHSRIIPLAPSHFSQSQPCQPGQMPSQQVRVGLLAAQFRVELQRPPADGDGAALPRLWLWALAHCDGQAWGWRGHQAADDWLLHSNPS